MKFVLLCTLAAACLLASEARTVQGSRNDKILGLLQRLEKEFGKRDLSAEDDEWEDEVRALVASIAPKAANKPVFQIDMDKLTEVFIAVVTAVDSEAPAELEEIAGARLAKAYLEAVVYGGVDHLWKVADEAFVNLIDLAGSGSGSGSGVPTKRNLSPFGNHGHSAASKKFSKREAPQGTEADDFWSVVYEKIIAPNYAILEEIDEILSPIDNDFHGSFFIDLYFMAESDSLLSRSVSDVAVEVAGQLGYALYTPPSGDATGVLEKVLNAIDAWTQQIRSLNTAVIEASSLPEDEKAAALTIVQSILPLIDAYIGPVEYMVHLYVEESEEKLGEFFLTVLGHVLSESYDEMRQVLPAIQEALKEDAEIVDRLIAVIKSGKGKTVFKALFTDVVRGAVGAGVDLDDSVEWVQKVLSNVDQVLAEKDNKIKPRSIKGMTIGSRK